MWDRVWDFVPFVAVIAVTSLLVVIVRAALRRKDDTEGDTLFLRGMVVLSLVLAGLIGAVVTLPIKDSIQGQLLAMLGLVLSATITLSSTTFVGNLIAGILLRALRKFQVGDYVRVNDHFGRVSERRMFHTEIQTEASNLTTLPNLYLVIHPVTVVRTSGTGTVIDAEVSLGYDVPHAKAERLLVAAAAATGLAVPFVRIRKLGDFSVTYQCAGLLNNPARLLAVESSLRGHMLDELHGAGVEIVSPAFMDQRQLPSGRKVMPRRTASPEAQGAGESVLPREEVVFDKAEQAVSQEKLQSHLARLTEKRSELQKQLAKTESEHEKTGIQRDIDRTALFERLVKEKLDDGPSVD